MKNDAGWLLINDVKDQCSDCKHVVIEQKMAACGFERREFGNAHNCPVYRKEGA